MTDDTTFHLSEPKLCANGCGFFGTASTMNLCSKCYRDSRAKEEQAISDKNAAIKLAAKKQNQTGGAADMAEERFSFKVPPVGPPDAAAAVAADPGTETVAKNRCSSCRKKVGLIGFKCRCGSLFCGSHRYPELHGCSLNYKASGRDAIATANPEVVADKLEHRL